jgi:hypothetical protein
MPASGRKIERHDRHVFPGGDGSGRSHLRNNRAYIRRRRSIGGSCRRIPPSEGPEDGRYAIRYRHALVRVTAGLESSATRLKSLAQARKTGELCW